MFYDVTTLYFEIEQEDELRRTGFSKDGKHQNPQIVLGLLVSVDGYPLAYDVFDGKQFEGHTLMPVIEGFKQRYGLEDLVVVADAGLLSSDNIENLQQKQFEYINATAISFMEADCPVISVDCKKKELVGNYKTNGTEWEQKKNATEVKVYDFVNKELGKAIPYGVYDIAKNGGFVHVGISSDTAEFAVNTIRTWWKEMGKEQYQNAKKLLITADGGGSNSSRGRLWKTELQKLSTEIEMELNVCHFPPGTSKWNKIEHRLFSYISKNWRAKPLTSIEVVVNLIANTTTEKGLKVRAKKDDAIYAKSIKISDNQLEEVNLKRSEFRGDWNYAISP